MTMDFTGEAVYGLDVSMHKPFAEPLGGETIHLSRPDGQDLDDFLRAVDEFHEAIMRQEHEFTTIGGHCIRPDAVERIALTITYVKVPD